MQTSVSYGHNKINHESSYNLNCCGHWKLICIVGNFGTSINFSRALIGLVCLKQESLSFTALALGKSAWLARLLFLSRSDQLPACHMSKMSLSPKYVSYRFIMSCQNRNETRFLPAFLFLKWKKKMYLVSFTWSLAFNNLQRVFVFFWLASQCAENNPLENVNILIMQKQL